MRDGVRVRGSGIEVVLVEADQIGRGSTGSAAGWIGDDPGVPFVEVEKTLGRAAARDAFKSWRRAALDFAAAASPARHQVRVQARGRRDRRADTRIRRPG